MGNCILKSKTRSTKIYGAEWDGNSSPVWRRTDEAKLLANPSPAVNNGNGSSPFDTIQPWAGLIREERTGGTMVKIPKYWYKWTRDGTKMKLQISASPITGFFVSPAHADRGDGSGERDYVYVGAYHCADTTYKSTTGVLPQLNKTRAEFRTAIHNLGANIWQYDFAMFWTIAMLYLVEYAHWNEQDKIGYGCGNNTAVENSGLCDNMQYHTGTNATIRHEYGHIRYRYIEGLWDNALDYIDGIYFSGNNVYCIKNPTDFSDNSGGTLVGQRNTTVGYITAMTNPTAQGFEYALFPNAVGGSNGTYMCDQQSTAYNGTVLCTGASYGQKLARGLFAFDDAKIDTSTGNYMGARIMELP